MNSTLKILVPIAILMAVIFALTFFSLNVPSDDRDKQTNTTASNEPPLRFFTSTRKWEPFDPFKNERDPEQPRPDIQNHIFPGYFEAGDTHYGTTFWFENRNDKAVKMRLTKVGCSACTGGRLAPISPDATRALLQMTAVSLLPQGAVATLPLGMVGPSAGLVTGLQWNSQSFQELDKVVYDIPAANDTDGWSPQWGILELNFRPGGANPLTAEFSSHVEGTNQSGTNEFKIFYATANPFEVDTPAIDFGDLNDTSPTLERVFLIGSTTRTADRLADLKVQSMLPGGVPDTTEFVTASKPVQLQGADFKEALNRLEIQSGHPLRILTAYRVVVSIRTKIGASKVDIGKLEREVWVSIPGPADPKRVLVRANVQGQVYLTDAKDINLGTFDSQRGANKTEFLTTERPDIELGVVPELSVPKALQVKLTKLPERNGRGRYELVVTMPAKEQDGEISSGIVVLEVKGANPQKIRIPVRGRGQRR